MAETFYRKYRPKDFSGLYGQKQVKTLLENAIEKDSVSHAYIFSGPRGTGKTTVARILAKRLNCENPNDFEPCNECSQCINIAAGNHMDVIEMDAASNRGIDDFRSIRDKVSYKPAEGKYKIYIIDEVHMLTTEAFNAILKTLEEPPEHAVFVLATTNPEKIPDTIISRCQLVPFRNLSPDDLESFMEYIADKEGFKISEEALKTISDYSKGGMRDALVLLEQVSGIVENDETVTYDHVLQVIGGVKKEIIRNFIDCLLKNDSNSLIEQTEEIYRQGTNFEVFLDSMIDYIINNISDYPFDKIIIAAEKITELSKSLKFAENKKAIFIITFLSIMKSNEKTEKPVFVVDTQEELSKNSSIKDNIPVVKEEGNTTQSLFEDPLLEEFIQNIKNKDISLYVSLMVSDTEYDNSTLKVKKMMNIIFLI